jgi:invasion protein IalB
MPALRRPLLALGLTIGACCLAWPALAQKTDVPASASSWRVECSNNGKALDCRAVAEVVQRDNHQIITALTIRYPAATKKPVMMVQVPLGVLVSEAVTLQVDGGKSEQAKVQTCTKAGCFAGSPVPDAMIAAMRGGKQIKVVFYNVNKQPVTVTLPLAGFGLAYDKIKS